MRSRSIITTLDTVISAHMAVDAAKSPEERAEREEDLMWATMAFDIAPFWISPIHLGDHIVVNQETNEFKFEPFGHWMPFGVNMPITVNIRFPNWTVSTIFSIRSTSRQGSRSPQRTSSSFLSVATDRKERAPPAPSYLTPKRPDRIDRPGRFYRCRAAPIALVHRLPNVPRLKRIFGASILLSVCEDATSSIAAAIPPPVATVLPSHDMLTPSRPLQPPRAIVEDRDRHRPSPSSNSSSAANAVPRRSLSTIDP